MLRVEKNTQPKMRPRVMRGFGDKGGRAKQTMKRGIPKQ